jgi:hypothetical protein
VIGKHDWLRDRALEEGLNLISKIFKNHVANQSGNDGNNEIGDRENVFYGENQALSLVIGMSKLPHQKV